MNRASVDARTLRQPDCRPGVSKSGGARQDDALMTRATAIRGDGTEPDRWSLESPATSSSNHGFFKDVLVFEGEKGLPEIGF